MAMILKRENEISVLKLSLTRPSGAPAHVTLQLDVHNEPIEPAHSISAEELALRARPSGYSDPSVNLPQETAGRMLAQLHDAGHDGGPLFLEFSTGAEVLSMLPWERALAPRLDLPVLRLPYYALDSQRGRGELDVVICASAPEAKMRFPLPELVRHAVVAVLEMLSSSTRVHVFAGVGDYPALLDRFRADGLLDNLPVRLYDPAAAEDDRPPSRPAGKEGAVAGAGRGAISNPWLRWMSEQLTSVAPDIVMFMCHGYYAHFQGSLAIAQGPQRNEDPHWARFIGPTELQSFLRHTGASATAFIAPRPNFSIAGLRDLADAIARARPGPVCVHDIEGDDNLMQLGRTLAFLFRQPDLARQVRDQTSLYVHPHRLRAERPAHPEELAFLEEAPAEAPRWFSAVRRSMEQSAARLTKAQSKEIASESGSAMNSGTEEALKFISQCLQSFGSEKGGSL